MQLYQTYLQHPIICTDSRICPSGSLFFALKGDNFDANAFALSALKNGCSYAVVDEDEYAIDERFILVENVLESLQELARYHRRQLGTKVIGITGTNGKTTTKELIAAVLKEKYNILFTQGNLNNHIGVPLTLLQLKPEHEVAIIEMGANHPEEIKALAEIAEPDYGIITNVGMAHLEGFGSFEGVKKTKRELYEYIYKADKAIFINENNEHLLKMANDSGFFLNSKNVISYSLDKNSSSRIKAEVTDCSPFLEMKCFIDENESFNISTKLIGAYNAENVLAAVTIGEHFGLSEKELTAGLEKYNPQNNRSQFSVTANNKLIIDTYNANPTSMKAAILNFVQMNVDGKTLILGDMLELGEQSNVEHQGIIDLLQQNKLTDVLLVGNNFRSTNNPYTCFDEVSKLINYIKNKPICNKYVLIKGSRGIKLEKVVPLL